MVQLNNEVEAEKQRLARLVEGRSNTIATDEESDESSTSEDAQIAEKEKISEKERKKMEKEKKKEKEKEKKEKEKQEKEYRKVNNSFNIQPFFVLQLVEERKKVECWMSCSELPKKIRYSFISYLIRFKKTMRTQHKEEKNRSKTQVTLRESTPKQENTPLHTTTKVGNADMIKKYLEQYSINCKDLQGQTPLHIAAGEGHLDIVQLLIKEASEMGQALEYSILSLCYYSLVLVKDWLIINEIWIGLSRDVCSFSFQFKFHLLLVNFYHSFVDFLFVFYCLFYQIL